MTRDEYRLVMACAPQPVPVAAALDRLRERWACSESEAVRRAIVVAEEWTNNKGAR